MKIRTMQSSDLTQVIELASQLGYSCDPNSFENRFIKISCQLEHLLLVALIEEKIVGWLHMCVEAQSLLSDARADVGALVVDEKYRGTGIGKALIIESEKWAKKNSLPIVRVRSNTKRLDAHRFYLREGYKIEKSWHLFTKEMSK